MTEPRNPGMTEQWQQRGQGPGRTAERYADEDEDFSELAAEEIAVPREARQEPLDASPGWHAPAALAPGYDEPAYDAPYPEAPYPEAPYPEAAGPAEAPPYGYPNGYPGYPEADPQATTTFSGAPSDYQGQQWGGYGYGAQPVPVSYPAGPGYGAASAPPPSLDPRSARAPRRARLTLRHIDPWSTLKFSLVLAIALFVVWMVAVGVLYGVLAGMGVFDRINSTVNEVNGSTGDVVTPQIVMGAAAVVGAVNIVLFTALATIGSFIYNLCADVVGGLEITLAERD